MATSTKDPLYKKYGSIRSPYDWETGVYEIVDYGKPKGRVLQRWYPSVHYICSPLSGFRINLKKNGYWNIVRPLMEERIRIFLSAIDMIIVTQSRKGIFVLAGYRREVESCEEVQAIDERFGQLLLHFHTLSEYPLSKSDWFMIQERMVPFTSLWRFCFDMADKSVEIRPL